MTEKAEAEAEAKAEAKAEADADADADVPSGSPLGPPEESAFDAVRASWGFPAFARDFPRHAELDELVAAYTRGDYRAVREGAPKLAARAEESDEVRRAAAVLRDRIEPDSAAKVFFLLTAALLVFLSAWWVAHDGPHDAGRPPEPPPKVELPR